MTSVHAIWLLWENIAFQGSCDSKMSRYASGHVRPPLRRIIVFVRRCHCNNLVDHSAQPSTPNSYYLRMRTLTVGANARERVAWSYKRENGGTWLT